MLKFDLSTILKIMTTATIRKKLHDFINTADDKHVKAVYSIVEKEVARELSDDNASSKNNKIKLMKQASSDPLFLADLKEINEDFTAIDNEGI